MTDLATGFDQQVHTGTGGPPTEPLPVTTLITEQEVLLGSAAALAGPRVRRNYFAMVRATLTSARTSDKPHKPRHYPQHHEFIEAALMSRMMERL